MQKQTGFMCSTAGLQITTFIQIFRSRALCSCIKSNILKYFSPYWSSVVSQLWPASKQNKVLGRGTYIFVPRYYSVPCVCVRIKTCARHFLFDNNILLLCCVEDLCFSFISLSARTSDGSDDKGKHFLPFNLMGRKESVEEKKFVLKASAYLVYIVVFVHVLSWRLSLLTETLWFSDFPKHSYNTKMAKLQLQKKKKQKNKEWGNVCSKYCFSLSVWFCVIRDIWLLFLMTEPCKHD